jgi:hypothetical protein
LRNAKHLGEIWASYFWRAKRKRQERKKEDEEEKLALKHMF